MYGRYSSVVQSVSGTTRYCLRNRARYLTLHLAQPVCVFNTDHAHISRVTIRAMAHLWYLHHISWQFSQTGKIMHYFMFGTLPRKDGFALLLL